MSLPKRASRPPKARGGAREGSPRVPEKEAPADYDLRTPDYETVCLSFSEAQFVTLLLWQGLENEYRHQGIYFSLPFSKAVW